MSRSSSVRAIKSELKKVNKVIDQKIIHGLVYSKEARYHKDLLARLRSLTRHSWLGSFIFTRS